MRLLTSGGKLPKTCFGDGSDGTCVIREDTVLCAKEYNFKNFYVCSGKTVYFCGNGTPVIKVYSKFENCGTIEARGAFGDVGNAAYTSPEIGLTVCNIGGNYSNYANEGGYWFGGAGGKNGGGGCGYACDGCIGEDGHGGNGGDSGCGTAGGGYAGYNGGAGGWGCCGDGGGGGGGAYGYGKGGAGGNTEGGSFPHGGDGGNGFYGGDGGRPSCNYHESGSGNSYGFGGNGGVGIVCGGNATSGINIVPRSYCGTYGGCGGNAFTNVYGLVVLARNFYNNCIAAGGGIGGNGACGSETGGKGGNGADGGQVLIGYEQMLNAGSIDVSKGLGGIGYYKTSVCDCCSGTDGNAGSVVCCKLNTI